MMINGTDLTKKIKSEFPRIRKPRDYANVILEGVKLRAFNSSSAKKRGDFLESGKIKEHVFVNSYLKLGLLVSIREADKIPVIASARVGLIFSYSYARQILNDEKDSLFAHIVSEPNIKSHVTNALKLSSASSIETIKSKMSSGDLMRQAGVYEKVYRNLVGNGVRPKGYMWLGVRTIPVSHYYLSNKSKNLLVKE